MPTDTVSRRDFSVAIGAAMAGIGLSGAARADAPSAPADADGVTRNHAAIHHEITFAAEPARVYQALTVTNQFDRVVRLGAGADPAMAASLGTTPTRIDAHVGGSFALFGGYITGINFEMVPAVRLVQVWRAGSWPANRYSLVTFALSGMGARTLLAFDHTGFPDEAADHLAKGWHAHYWDPLAKFLQGA